MTRKIDAVILLLQVYFVVMNVTVERLYCRSELREGFLVRETLAFCAKYNPLFLARPPWIVAVSHEVVPLVESLCLFDFCHGSSFFLRSFRNICFLCK
mmetsp:Transcript_23973/g.77153  ORF Transcript_23973/g.77153 Transcript_23973/m.77153 type:complete len:98 (+) Transcript_23973:47-340(+)